jgi:protein TonB
MRTAAGFSVAIHLGLIAGAWIVMGWQPEINEMSAESVSVEIISMDAVSENPSDMVTANNQNLVSAGAEREAMEVAEVEPAVAPPVEQPEYAKPVAPAVAAEAIDTEELVSAEIMTATTSATDAVQAMVPQIIDATADVVADTVAASQSDPLDALRPATLADLSPEDAAQAVPPALLQPAEPIQAIETASLAPVVEEEPQVVPIPRPRLVRTPVEPVAEPAKETPKATTKPVERPQDEPPSKQATLGNGGASDADSAASSKSGGGAGKTNAGGSAAVSKYPGLVQARVARAAKRPKGSAGGEALVSFTVSASGGVTRIGLARSSGNDAVDQAAIAAVNRAAPFPPIPAEAGRSSWQFTVPIQFKT